MTSLELIQMTACIVTGAAFGNLIAENQINRRYGSVIVAIIGLFAFMTYLLS
jgi:hypothetical protein